MPTCIIGNGLDHLYMELGMGWGLAGAARVGIAGVKKLAGVLGAVRTPLGTVTGLEHID